jgi:hypothetical protein
LGQEKKSVTKRIDLALIDAFTISQSPSKKSDEFLIHMKGAYDHRFMGGSLRDTIVDLLRRIRRQIGLKM